MGNIKSKVRDIGNIKVLCDKGNTHIDLIKSIQKKVSVSDYIVLKNIEELDELLKSNPFFSDYYIVEVDLKKFKRDVINVMKSWVSKCDYVRFVVLCYNSDMIKKLDWCNRAFNSYKISYKYFNVMLKNRLNDYDLKYANYYLKIYNKLKGHYNLTDNIAFNINSGKDLSTVVNSIRFEHVLSFENFWVELLMHGDKKRIFDFVSRYKYGYSTVLKFMKTKIKEYKTYYDDFYNGKLNITTLRHYCSENKVSEYKVKTAYDIITVVSYDKFILMCELIDLCKNDSYSFSCLIYNIYYIVRLYEGDYIVVNKGGYFNE